MVVKWNQNVRLRNGHVYNAVKLNKLKVLIVRSVYCNYALCNYQNIITSKMLQFYIIDMPRSISSVNQDVPV